MSKKKNCLVKTKKKKRKKKRKKKKPTSSPGKEKKKKGRQHPTGHSTKKKKRKRKKKKQKFNESSCVFAHGHFCLFQQKNLHFLYHITTFQKYLHQIIYFTLCFIGSVWLEGWKSRRIENILFSFFYVWLGVKKWMDGKNKFI